MTNVCSNVQLFFWPGSVNRHSLMHSFLDCNCIRDLWEELEKCISSTVEEKVTFTSSLCLHETQHRVHTKQSSKASPLSTYGRVNTMLPLLRSYFDPEEDTKADFRMSREALHSLMHQLNTHRCHGLGGELEVLILAYWLAHGLTYSVVSRALGVPKTTVHDVTHRMAAQLVRLKDQIIHHPMTAAALHNVGQGFAALAGHEAFSTCVGAIDGCHVRIKAPSTPDAQDYFNRKLFHSVQFQAVCDSKGQFLDMFVGYPGSVHYSRILKHSYLYEEAVFPPPGYFIVGGGGYPCLERPITLMTTFR
ncbi:hypothetical protein SKAU_G00245370, partial [Synaphobranchus kaupii]